MPVTYLKLFRACHFLLTCSRLCALCRVPTELKKKIQQARLEKKLTQAQLGQLINEKPNVRFCPVACTQPQRPCAVRFDAECVLYCVPLSRDNLTRYGSQMYGSPSHLQYSAH